MNEWVTAFIGLGSNLQAPKAQLQRAFSFLQNDEKIKLIKASAMYASKPMGTVEQPDFINAVAWIETSLAPYELLCALQAQEQRQHRRRLLRWGPRTIDLDILLYSDLVMAEPELTIPHPGLYLRDFVLKPLLSIAPHLILPNGKSIQDALSQCVDSTIE